MIMSTDGHTEIFGNGGAGYPIPDQIMLQAPQSCVNSGGSLTVVAAVSYSSRSSQTSGRPFLSILLKIFHEHLHAIYTAIAGMTETTTPESQTSHHTGSADVE